MKIPHSSTAVTLAACAMATTLIPSAARAGDVALTITNDGTTDVVVTVYDLNAEPNRPVLAGQRLYGFSSVLVSVSADGTGRGHVAWTATSDGGATPQCGHDVQRGLTTDQSVAVHADGDCSAI